MYLRCKNAGKNQKLHEICDKYEIEFTAPNIPQQNGVVERGFAMIRQRAVAMMHGVKISKGLRKLIWAEALNTLTTLVNQLCVMTLTMSQLYVGTPIMNQLCLSQHTFCLDIISYPLFVCNINCSVMFLFPT